ncbi:site-specific integrase [uncultured Nocardioides sp.]|uniref:tyrosine-type recombinase/integrase n=1 Tax=uncultured Nocardioides sp. TaxID=198441 RepID=UPI0026175C7F|nr:site-specific integrase [uncultured Nocardioides sp.]HRD62911.1 site-specific integrase [Nocardioides sp.]
MPGIEKRPIRGGVRYVVRVRDPERGKYTSATFATEPEAERFVSDVEQRDVSWALAEYRRAKDEADELTLNEWAEIHFSALTEPSGATVRRYRNIYAETWKPALGHLRLSQIGRVQVAQALNAVPGSDKTVLNKWAVLTHMFKMAAQDGKITRSPTIGVKPGRRTEHETEEHRYLTHAEFWAVVEATPEYWRPLVITLAGTGLRWGELAALTVGDVDTEHRLLRITKAEKQDPDNPSKTIIGPTKTKKSRRSVSLPVEVLDVLEPLTEGRRRNERLFLPPNGGPLRHRTFYRDIWLKKSVGNSGIRQPYPRLHDLRHSHVAWLLAIGVPGGLATIQARLGHEKITTTIDTYGHLEPDVQRAAGEAAGLVFAARPQLA